MKTKILHAFLFFLVLSCITLPFQVKAQNNASSGDLDLAFSSLVTPIISGFFDINAKKLINPITGPGSEVIFDGNFPKFSASLSDVNFEAQTDYGVRIVPYFYPNGTQTQVRAFMKDYKLSYSLTVETKMVDGDFQQTPIELTEPIYQLWRFIFPNNVLTAALDVTIPSYQYEANYKQKALQVAQGQLQVDFIVDPVNAFPSGSEEMAFIQNFNTTLGDYKYVDYWIGVVNAKAGYKDSDGFTDQHGIEFLKGKQDYDDPFQNEPTAGTVQVSYGGIIDAWNETINGGVLDYSAPNSNMVLSRITGNETYNPSAFDSVMYDGALIGANNLEMRAKYYIEIAPKIDEYKAKHVIHGAYEYQIDPDGLLPLFGWQTTDLIWINEEPVANLGITVANRYARFINEVTVRIVSFYDFDPLLPENEFQTDPEGVTGDRTINPEAWGTTSAVVQHFNFSNLIILVLIVIAAIAGLAIVVKLIKRHTDPMRKMMKQQEQLMQLKQQREMMRAMEGMG
ncbi:MAG: hypothetical protein ACTSVY_07415 [Candidatus Helarchaeota archaeon]